MEKNGSVWFLPSFALLGISASACGASDLVRECKELVAPVEEAVSRPSGTLDAASAQALLKRVYGTAVSSRR